MRPLTRLVSSVVDSPLGSLRLIAADDGLMGLFYAAHRRPRQYDAIEVVSHSVLDCAREELVDYFAGRRQRFTTPVAPPVLRGGTPFQHAVWDALLAIPFGQTRSYSDIARAIDRPHAVRAVGSANALNPLSIFVPCHRVVGVTGTLTGYAGGLDIKRWLLAHEGVSVPVTAHDEPPPHLETLQSTVDSRSRPS